MLGQTALRLHSSKNIILYDGDLLTTCVCVFTPRPVVFEARRFTQRGDVRITLPFSKGTIIALMVDKSLQTSDIYVNKLI